MRETHLDDEELLHLSLDPPRVSAEQQGENLRFTITLRLTEPDVAALPEPRTIDEVALRAQGGAEEATGETFEPATIDGNEPELAIVYRIRLPTEGLMGPEEAPGRRVHGFEPDPGDNGAPGTLGSSFHEGGAM